MDFELSADQLALRAAARELLDALASPARVRAVAEMPRVLDDELWQAMTEQGWLGVDVAESEGGLGLGAVEVAVLAEEAGAHVAPVPFLPTVVAIDACRRAGRTDLAAPLVRGRASACVAWSRDPAAVTATPAHGAWALRGTSDPIPFAPLADLAIVAAVDAEGGAVLAVDLREHGRPAREPAMDLTRPLARLAFDGTPAERLGGADHLEALLDRGATFTGLEMLGAAQRVLDMAVDYAKERVQFDRPIGSFQAVKHRCADMLVDVEGMRSSSYWAAWCLAAGDPDAAIAASTTKTWCSDASRRVMASALQVHGGIGFTWEHDLHLFLKRAQLDQVLFGDASFHRSRLAALLRPKVETGEGVV